jgi:hypothetical protein
MGTIKLRRRLTADYHHHHAHVAEAFDCHPAKVVGEDTEYCQIIEPSWRSACEILSAFPTMLYAVPFR